MAKRIETRNGIFWEQSLKMEKELEEGIKHLQLEGCRTTMDVSNFLLGKWSADPNATSAVRAIPDADNSSVLRTGYLKLRLPDTLYQALLAQSHQLEVSLSTVIRAYLWAALKQQSPKLAARRRDLSREVSTRWCDFRDGLSLIWLALRGRH